MTTQTVPKQARWEASERQGDFLGRTEFEVLYGGAKFGLKTDALLGWIIARREKYPRSRGLFIRRMIAEITKQGAAWERIQAILGSRVKYNHTDHTVSFPNGSVQEFGHCKDEADKMTYQGAQYDDICWDQLEQFTESQYMFILGACRTPLIDPPTSKEGVVIQPRVRCSANPGDIGHEWVKQRFIDVAPAGVPYSTTVDVTAPDGEVLKLTRSRVYVPASVFDSVKAGVVSADYIATLEAMPEPYRSAYLYGKWDIFIGQAFSEFDQRIHVIPTAPVHERWRLIASHDWGYDSPGHHLWGAIDPLGGIVIYREWSFRGLDPEEIASQVLYKQGMEPITTTWADPSIVGERRHADLTAEQVRTLQEKGLLQLSKYEQYKKAGFYVQLANNARIDGKQRIHTLLKPRLDGSTRWWPMSTRRAWAPWIGRGSY